MAGVALGCDVAQVARDARRDKPSGKWDKQSLRRKHDTNRLSRISSTSRLSWLSSGTTDETSVNLDELGSESDLSPQDRLSGRFPPSEFSLLRGGNKRPLSSPVLLKATFYHEVLPPSTFTTSPEQRVRSHSTASITESPSEPPLIDLASVEGRGLRSSSLHSPDAPASPASKSRDLNLDLSDVTLISSSSAAGADIVRRLSSSSPDGAPNPDVWKIPPPPLSPRTKVPSPDGTNHYEPGSEKVVPRWRRRPRHDSLSPASDKESRNLLDSPVEGQVNDRTRPLVGLGSIPGELPLS